MHWYSSLINTVTLKFLFLVYLSSLCAVDVCDESEAEETGYHSFKLHARKSTITLSAKSVEEVNEWVAMLQDVIDTSPTIQTITERVILEIIVSQTTWHENW